MKHDTPAPVNRARVEALAQLLLWVARDQLARGIPPPVDAAPARPVEVSAKRSPKR